MTDSAGQSLRTHSVSQSEKAAVSRKIRVRDRIVSWERSLRGTVGSLSLTSCHGVYAHAPAISAKHSRAAEAIAHGDIGDVGPKRRKSMGGQKGARGAEYIGGLLALLPLGTAVLEPDL